MNNEIWLYLAAFWLVMTISFKTRKIFERIIFGPSDKLDEQAIELKKIREEIANLKKPG